METFPGQIITIQLARYSYTAIPMWGNWWGNFLQWRSQPIPDGWAP